MRESQAKTLNCYFYHLAIFSHLIRSRGSLKSPTGWRLKVSEARSICTNSSFSRTSVQRTKASFTRKPLQKPAFPLCSEGQRECVRNFELVSPDETSKPSIHSLIPKYETHTGLLDCLLGQPQTYGYK